MEAPSRTFSVCLMLVVGIVASGCLTGETRDTGLPGSTEDRITDPSSEPDKDPSGRPANLTPASAETEVLPIAWNATTGSGVFACQWAAGSDCYTAWPTDGEESFYDGDRQGNVTAVDLEMVWEPASPITTEMGLGAMVMFPGCKACETVVFDEREGASPLTVQTGGLQVSLDHPDAILHLYVWEPALFHHQDPFYVYGSVEQSFSVTGTVTLTR